MAKIDSGNDIFFSFSMLLNVIKLGGNVLLEPAAAMLHKLSLVMYPSLPVNLISWKFKCPRNPGKSTLPESQPP